MHSLLPVFESTNQMSLRTFVSLKLTALHIPNEVSTAANILEVERAKCSLIITMFAVDILNKLVEPQLVHPYTNNYYSIVE